MGHCRTYGTAVHVIEKSKSSYSSTSKQDREDNRATSVSEQKISVAAECTWLAAIV